MRSIPACLSLLLLLLHGAGAGTAFEALKFLSPEQLQRVALIAGRDGSLEPERWHILVHDPTSAENNLREIVVAGGKKATERPLSQFAERLKADDVIPADMLKVDSDKLAKLGMKFGTANNVTVSAMHFDLRRSGPESAALWTVTCLDATGTELGKLIVSAAKGTVLLHPGFVAEPELDAVAESPTTTTVAATNVDRPQEPDRRNNARRERRSAPPPAYQPYRRATPFPQAAATPKPGLFQRLFTPPEKPRTPPR